MINNRRTNCVPYWRRHGCQRILEASKRAADIIGNAAIEPLSVKRCRYLALLSSPEHSDTDTTFAELAFLQSYQLDTQKRTVCFLTVIPARLDTQKSKNSLLCMLTCEMKSIRRSVKSGNEKREERRRREGNGGRKRRTKKEEEEMEKQRGQSNGWERRRSGQRHDTGQDDKLFVLLSMCICIETWASKLVYKA